jgi:uncharacterized repeat protein (TIGR01451 family)
MQGTVYMYYDPNLVYYNSSIVPSTINIGTQTLSWNITSNVGQTTSIFNRFVFPAWLPLGTPVFNTIVFVPAPGYIDANASCDMDTVHQVSLASWDPNDKMVSPLGVGPEGRIHNDQWLDYTIVFQNTGTSPAVNVILLDTLDNNLDIATLELKDASHSYQAQLENRELKWIFSNILLPDSGTDYDNSSGFASFRIRPLNPLADGTPILNTASIYFDYNEEVRTQTTINTIDYFLALNDLEGTATSITLRPNPFSRFTTISIEGSEAPYELRVMDALGKLVKHEKAIANTFKIERESLAAGMYTYQVWKDGKIIGKGKMAVQ